MKRKIGNSIETLLIDRFTFQVEIENRFLNVVHRFELDSMSMSMTMLIVQGWNSSEQEMFETMFDSDGDRLVSVYHS